MVAALVANVFNAVLDYVLVFGAFGLLCFESGQGGFVFLISGFDLFVNCLLELLRVFMLRGCVEQAEPVAAFEHRGGGLLSVIALERCFPCTDRGA